MSSARQQGFIEAPVEIVWDLVSEVERHPEWWPRVLEVHCDGLEEGCTYREVVKTPFGKETFLLRVGELDDCRNLAIKCLNTGTFVEFALTEAQDGTFVDTHMGMDPLGAFNRTFDAIAGQRYFRAWLAQTLKALERAACERAPASG